MQRSARALAAGARWRAWVARLLSVAVLLAALLVPPFAELGAAAAALSVSVAMSPSDANGAALAHPGGIVHAGAHCTCQLADRIGTQDQLGPVATGTVVHLVCTNPPLASRVADPPTRPPQA